MLADRGRIIDQPGKNDIADGGRIDGCGNLRNVGHDRRGTALQADVTTEHWLFWSRCVKLKLQLSNCDTGKKCIYWSIIEHGSPNLAVF